MKPGLRSQHAGPEADTRQGLWTTRFACAVSVVGVTLQAAAQNYPMFIVGRTIGGIACGIVCSVSPAYASELSPAHVRGRVGAL